MSFFTFQHKQIYYQELGHGAPLLLLHGNTASSAMFEEAAKRYMKNHTVILIDFLGHGKSERTQEIPSNLWFLEAQQVIAFLEEKNYTKVNLIGSSGGALVAINVALERPDLVHKVIADSFEGEYPLQAFIETISEQQELSKQDKGIQEFYVSMHGDDWEQVVDWDTQAVKRHFQEIGKFFHNPLEDFIPPLLFTGSKEDEFILQLDANYIEKTYSNMIQKIGHGEIFLFEKGNHPAMLSNLDAFVRITENFLLK